MKHRVHTKKINPQKRKQRKQRKTLKMRKGGKRTKSACVNLKQLDPSLESCTFPCKKINNK